MEKQRICQKFFMATLCISNGPIITAIKGKSVTGQFFNASDQRAKKINSLHNKTNIEDIDAIKSHINSFPVTESHYTRKSSKRHYLDEKLSILLKCMNFYNKNISWTHKSLPFLLQLFIAKYFAPTLTYLFSNQKRISVLLVKHSKIQVIQKSYY